MGSASVVRANRILRRARALVAIRTAEKYPIVYPGADLHTSDVCRLARVCVGDVLECNQLLLIGTERGTRKLAFARQLAIHLAHVIAGRRHDAVATCFRLNRSTASHHFEVLENLRDVEGFDRFLSLLEHRFIHLLRAAETRPRALWPGALEAMLHAVKRGELDANIHFDAKYVAETFTPKAKRPRVAP